MPNYWIRLLCKKQLGSFAKSTRESQGGLARYLSAASISDSRILLVNWTF